MNKFTKQMQMLAAVGGLLLAGAVQAVPYTLSLDEVTTFEVLNEDPAGSVQWYNGFSGDMFDIYFYSGAGDSATAMIGTAADPAKSFAGYDSLEMGLFNNGDQAIAASLFYTDTSGAYSFSDVPALEIASNTGITLNLDFGGSGVLASAYGFLVSTDLAAFDASLPYWAQYTKIRASVPEPGMLALIGIGLLGFGVTARGNRKSK